MSEHDDSLEAAAIEPQQPSAGDPNRPSAASAAELPAPGVDMERERLERARQQVIAARDARDAAATLHSEPPDD